MIAPDIPHDEVIRCALKLAFRKIRFVLIGGTYFPCVPVIDCLNAHLVGHRQGIVDVWRIPDSRSANRADSVLFLRSLCAFGMMMQEQRQAVESLDCLFKLRSRTVAVIHFVWVKSKLFPIGYFIPVIRYDLLFGDMTAVNVHKAVIVITPLALRIKRKSLSAEALAWIIHFCPNGGTIILQWHMQLTNSPGITLCPTSSSYIPASFPSRKNLL